MKLKKSTRGRKAGSYSFRRVKLKDVLDFFNIETKKAISENTSIIVSEKWASTVGINGVQVDAVLANTNAVNASGNGIKVKLITFGD